MDAKQLVQRYQPKQVKAINLDQQAWMVRFSPDGKLLAAACFDGTDKPLDATTDKFTALPAVTGHNGWVQCLASHPDGFAMAVTSGQPGTGKLFFSKPGDEQPFFVAPLPNCHSLAVHPNGTRLVVAATNANSAGNGRQFDKNKEYPGNFSPLHVWDLPKS